MALISNMKGIYLAAFKAHHPKYDIVLVDYTRMREIGLYTCLYILIVILVCNILALLEYLFTRNK